MSDRGELGKASLELTAETATFRKNIDEAKTSGRGMEDVLHAIAEAGAIADRALSEVRMSPAQGAESKASAEEILSGVRGISEESRLAAVELDRVRITEAQAAESVAAGDEIKHNVADIGDEADRTKRKLEETRLAGMAVGGTSLPILGAAIGAGALLAPALGPAMFGLLSAIPLLALTGAGALGTLMLAFNGVGAAIGGNQKAFDKLEPAQQKFVLDIRSLDGFLDHLKQTAAGNLFPGLDKALHETLTPGTIHLITQAIAEFSKAIGDAGQQWGRYFGSPQFQQTMGPILHAAAGGISDLSTVTLHLFDAFLKLGQAAIPFLNWLGDATIKGAKWLDTLVRARDATGQLGSAMHEAEISLTLVGHLIESLGRVVFALGSALYPVSKVAVKDLTDALNWLAHVINDNKTEIQSIVGGALSALRTMLHFLIPIVSELAHWLDQVVNSMGGWHTAFVLILSGLLASKFIALGKSALGFVGTLNGVVNTAVAKLTTLGTAEEAVGTQMVIAGTEAEAAIGGIAAAAYAALGPVGLLIATIAAAFVAYEAFSHLAAPGPSQKITATSPTANVTGAIHMRNAMWDQQGILQSVAPPHGKGFKTTHGRILSPSELKAKASLAAANKAMQAALHGGSGSYAGGGGTFGAQPPWTSSSTGGGGHGHATFHIPVALQDEIAKRWAKFSSNTTKHNEQLYLAAVDQAEKLAKSHGQSIAPYVADISKAQKLMEAKLAALAAAQAKKTIEKLAEQTAGPEMTLKIAQAAGAPTSVILADQQSLLAAYQTEAAALKAKLSSATGKAKAEYKAALSKVDQAIQSTEDAVVSSLQSIYQAAQQKLGSAASKMAQDVISQFEAQTQDYISNTLGPEFFQGGALTPLEQQLRDMQQQDQLQSLTDTLAQAQAAGDPAQIAAAQRALDEYNLQQEAAQQRAQADAAYAAAVKQYTDERAVEEAKLTTALDNWQQSVVDGTGSINDLNGIAESFGVTLTGLSDPNTGIGYDFSLLQTAANEAAVALANLTAAAGGTTTINTSGGGGGSTTTTGGSACFVAGTLVSTPTGDIAIERLEPGDIVLTYDFTAGTLVAAAVTDVERHEDDDERETLQAHANDRALVGTPDHLIYSGRDWVALEAAPALYEPEGDTTHPIRFTQGPRAAVYNLHVDHRDHNYVANGFLVHNSKVVPMANGGRGTVHVPTLFLAGEKGAEDFAFSGAGRSFSHLGDVMGHGGRGDVVLVVDERELGRAAIDGVSRDRHATHIAAKAIKPALATVTAIGG